ncbi:MAG: UvrD-helicase domain-containing protein [bacterium]|nr:UvrD-helicase domain-containing protein [bacterium]
MSLEQIAEAARSYGPILDKACAAACEDMWREGDYSDFELREGYEELWNLSEDKDLAYDRPSIGLHYALLYHLERTHLLVRGLMPLLTDRHKPLTIYDVGCGTGATAWAIAVIMEACWNTGVEAPRVRLTGLDTSPFMLKAGDHLWNALPDDFTRHFSPINQLGSWDRTQVANDKDSEGLIVGSFLFNASDHHHLAEVDDGLTRFSDRLGMDRLLLITPWSKTYLADDLVGRGNWGRDELFLPYGTNIWDGRPTRTDILRRKLWDHIVRTSKDLDRRYGPPRWSREYCQEYRLLGRTDNQMIRTDTNVWSQLSFEQQNIATPDQRLTYVVGSAGSGKSVVLIERLVQCIKVARRSEPPPRVLVTSFNKEMVGKLIDLAIERIGLSKNIHLIPVRDEGNREAVDWSMQARTVNGVTAKIRFINWDKLPTRVWQETQHDSELLKEPAVERHGDYRSLVRKTHGYDQNYIDNELRLIVYGLEAMSFDKYIDTRQTRRRGRRDRLSRKQRIEIWPSLKRASEQGDIWFRRRMAAWRHNESALRSGGRMALRSSCHDLTHVFVDEGQDMTRADIRMLAHTPPRPQRLFVVGDSTQALHNYGIGPRPQIPGASWVVPFLDGSYRLSALASDALADLAKSVLEGQALRRCGSDGEVPQVSRSAVPGPRPVIVSGADSDGMLQAMETMRRFDTRTDGSVVTWHVVQEGSKSSGIAELAKQLHGNVRKLSMLRHKGLERSLVVFPTDAQPPAGKSVPEWVYAALTRARVVLMIAVHPSETDGAVGQALNQLNPDKLMFWNQRARDAWETMTAGGTRSEEW